MELEAPFDAEMKPINCHLWGQMTWHSVPPFLRGLLVQSSSCYISHTLRSSILSIEWVFINFPVSCTRESNPCTAQWIPRFLFVVFKIWHFYIMSTSSKSEISEDIPWTHFWLRSLRSPVPIFSHFLLLYYKTQLSGNCHAVVKQLSGNRQVIIRQSSGSMQ